eukprot:1158214-Pelagomonas_calceolata.AAC.6
MKKQQHTSCYAVRYAFQPNLIVLNAWSPDKKQEPKRLGGAAARKLTDAELHARPSKCTAEDNSFVH